MELTAVDLGIIFAAIAVGSFVKGLTGAGLPQIAIPVMAIFLGVEQAVVVMVIPGILSNGWLMWTYRKELTRSRDMPVLLATGTIGAVGGTWMLKAVDPRLLSAILAGIIIVYVVLRLTRPAFSLPPAVTRVLSWPVGAAAGTLQGATGISGPLLTTYLHAYRLDPALYVVSLTTLFQVFSVVQAVTLLGMGMITPVRAVEGVFALVPMMIALPLGTAVARRISGQAFDKWILVVLLASASKLLHSAIWG